MKNSMCLRDHSHRVFSFSVIISIDVFSVPAERAAVTAGGDLRGLGGMPPTSIFAVSEIVTKL